MTQSDYFEGCISSIMSSTDRKACFSLNFFRGVWADRQILEISPLCQVTTLFFFVFVFFFAYSSQGSRQHEVQQDAKIQNFRCRVSTDSAICLAYTVCDPSTGQPSPPPAQKKADSMSTNLINSWILQVNYQGIELNQTFRERDGQIIYHSKIQLRLRGSSTAARP